MEWQFWRAATVSRRWRNVTHGQVRKSLLAVKHTTIQAGFKHFNPNCDIWQLSSRWDTWKLCQKYPNSSLYNVGMPPSIITGQKWCLADPGGTSLYFIIASGDHPCLKKPSSSTHFFRVFRCIGWAELLKFGFILCDRFGWCITTLDDEEGRFLEQL